MTETFQISPAQAEVYETLFVPALFGQWAPLVVEAAALTPGQRVLDVACGTGVVARAAADRVGRGGTVVGVDLNQAMLDVAARVAPHLTWVQGDVAALPFPENSFDAVLCQSSLMFFPDRAAAMAEMVRVTVPGGRVVVQTYAPLERQPGYGPLVAVVARHAGEEARVLLGAYWSAGDAGELRRLAEGAGLRVLGLDSPAGVARFPSVASLVETEVRATPLGDRLSEGALDRITADAEAALGRFRTRRGDVELPLSARVLVAQRREE